MSLFVSKRKKLRHSMFYANRRCVHANNYPMLMFPDISVKTDDILERFLDSYFFLFIGTEFTFQKNRTRYLVRKQQTHEIKLAH